MSLEVYFRMAALLGAVLLYGCGPSEDTLKPKVLRIAYTMGTSELIHQSAQQMAELVESKSGGTIQVRLYPAGQLGNDQGVTKQSSFGRSTQPSLAEPP